MGLILGAVWLARPPPAAPAPDLRGKLVLHRAGAPENSRLALERAVAAGAEAIELDVRWGTAGEPVCAHDAEQADGAPALADMLDLALANGLLVELDLKTGPLGDRALVREVGRQIRQRQAQDRVWVSAFHPLAAWFLRREAPEIPLGWPLSSTGWPLVDTLTAWDGPARWMGASVLEPHEALVTERRLARWTRRWPLRAPGRPCGAPRGRTEPCATAGSPTWPEGAGMIEVWVVHDPQEIEALRARGLAVVVDAL